MKRNLWLGIAGCAVISLALTGCGKKAASAGNEGKKTSIRIAMIAKSSTNPVFLSARTGAEAAAKDITKNKGVKVDIVWMTPPNEDGQVQAQNITKAVNDGVDAILLSCSDASKVTGAINEAVESDIPVMTFDSDAPSSKRFAFYGVNDIKSGEVLMRELATQIGGKGNIAILAGNQMAPNLQARVKGVTQEAAKYPGIKIVKTFYHIETPADAAMAVNQAMNQYPEITGWAMVGGWPLFTKTLLNDLDPSKVKVVAIDCLPAQLPYIEKGIAPVLLAQPCYKWGYVSVQKIVDKVALNKDVPTLNEMELVRVDKKGLGSWARQLKDWGMTGIPEKYLSMK